jgi:hypothetical protein
VDLAGARAWAAEFGLNGPLGATAADGDVWLQGATDEERAMADALLSSALDLSTTANAASYFGRLRNMLHWLALFLERLPHYQLFLPLGGADELAHYGHNEETLLRFSQFIRDHGSIARGHIGETLRSDSISGIISTLRAYRSLEARYALRPRYGDLNLIACYKGMRRIDGPAGGRALRLGIRSIDFKTLRDTSDANRALGITPVWNTATHDGIMRDCAAGLAHSLVARGCELGLVEGMKQHEFDPTRGFVIGDITWHEPSSASGGYHWVMVWWFPMKDTNCRHKKHPIPISRRHHGPQGADPQCAYDKLWAAWHLRATAVPFAAWARTPFFVTAAGKIYTSYTVRDIARCIAEIIGIDIAASGASSFRIGGASCIRETHGDAEGQRMLEERGRWASDIASIYSRLSASTHLTASRAMMHAPGLDVERITGWAQQR